MVARMPSSAARALVLSAKMRARVLAVAPAPDAQFWEPLRAGLLALHRLASRKRAWKILETRVLRRARGKLVRQARGRLPALHFLIRLHLLFRPLRRLLPLLRIPPPTRRRRPGLVADGAEIDDDALEVVGLQLHLAKVGRGGLEGVEQESGDFRIELPGDEQAHDLHERHLDALGVLENWHGEAEGGPIARSAGSAPTPLPHGLLESARYAEKEAKIFEMKGLTGKILRTNESIYKIIS